MQNETREQIGLFLKNTSQYFGLFILYALVRGLGKGSLNEFGLHVFDSLIIVGTLIIFSALIFYILVNTHSFRINYVVVIVCLIITILIFEVFLVTRI